MKEKKYRKEKRGNRKEARGAKERGKGAPVPFPEATGHRAAASPTGRVHGDHRRLNREGAKYAKVFLLVVLILKEKHRISTEPSPDGRVKTVIRSQGSEVRRERTTFRKFWVLSFGF
jgi:hypothetical protein